MILATLLTITAPLAQQPSALAQQDAYIPVQELGIDVLDHADPVVRAWSEDWHAGRLDPLLASLEGNLGGDDPHPFASWMWVNLQERRSHDLEDAVASTSAAVRSQVGEPARVHALYVANRIDEILAEYPVERIAQANDYFLLHTLGWAFDGIDSARLYAASLRLLELYPDDWYCVWTMIGCFDSDDRYRLRALDDLAPTTELGQTNGGRSCYWFAELANGHDEADTMRPIMIHHVREWLAAHPGDWGAHAHLGTTLRLANYPAESVNELARAAKLAPLRIYADRAAWELINLNRLEDARHVLQAWAGHEGLELDREYAKACDSTGAPGLARIVLDDLLEATPNDAKAQAIYAKIELDAGRPKHALPYAQAAFDHDPSDLDQRNLLFGALKASGRQADAAALGAAVFESGAFASSDQVRTLLVNYGDLLDIQGESEQALAVGRALIDLLPDSAWLWRRLAEDLDAAGHHDEAQRALTSALERDPNDNWSLYRLYDWAARDGGDTAGFAALTGVHERWPTVRLAWEIAVYKLADAPERQVEIFERAAAANPRRAWPIVERANQMFAEDPAAAFELFATAEGRGVPGEAASLHWHRARKIRRAVVNQGRSFPDMIPVFHADAAIALAANCESTELLHDIGWVHGWEGEQEAAGQDWLQAALANPNNVSFWTNLKHTDFTEGLKQGFVNSLLMRIYERDPFDGDRVNSITHYFAKWGGSPIEAMRLADHLEREQPDAFLNGRASRERDYLLGNAGAHRFSFERRYSRSKYLTSSEKYIKWYETARDEALNAEWVQVEFDLESGLRSTMHADGRVDAIGFHRFSGRPTHIQRGAAWIRATYADEYGDQLGTIETSSGRSVELGYDAAGRQSFVRDSSGESIEYEYDDEGRTLRIQVSGVGEVRFTDVNGEWTGEPISDGGEDVLEDVFARLWSAQEEVVSLATRLGSADLMGLLPPDPEEERLGRAIAATVDYQSNVEAALSFTRYLVDNLGTRPNASDTALGTMFDLWAPLTQEPDAWEMERLIELAQIWHEFDAKQYPMGLPIEAAKSRAARRRALLDLSARTGNTALAEAVATFDAEPHPILDHEHWLPSSDLDNDAYWRGWGPGDLAPSRRAGSLQVQSLLARANGDVVVGSNLGLHVLRAGWWQWFVFDENIGAFVEGTVGHKTTASSKVQALAESTDGQRLWVGTANGLIEIATIAGGAAQSPGSEYMGATSWYATQDDGMPSPSALHLTPWRDGVVVGTPNGAVHYMRDGAPMLLTSEPIRLLNASPWMFAGEAALDREALAQAINLEPGREQEQMDELEQAYLAGEPVGPILRAIDAEVEADDAFLQQVLEENFLIVNEELGEVLLVGTASALLSVDQGSTVRTLLERSVQDAILDPWSRSVYLLDLQRVLQASWVDEGLLEPFTLPDQQNVVGEKHGLAMAPIDGRDGWAIGVQVLTDAGVSIYADGHFEHLKLHGGDRSDGARDLGWFQRDDGVTSWYVLTPTGVRGFDRTSAYTLTGRVNDIVSSDAWGLSFVAFDDGSGIYAVDHADGQAVPFAGVQARVLALDSDDNLITNDGTEIVQFDVGSTTWRHLFQASPTQLESGGAAWNVKDIVLDPDGTMWVLAGGSVFRWKGEGTEAEEFSFAVDPERFPSKTWTVASLFRGPDERLYAIGSFEGHVLHKGQNLKGGVLVFEPETDRFVRHADDAWTSSRSAMFWLSHTRLDERRSIVGTADDFYLIQDGLLVEPLDESESYQALYADDPRLWMGTEGVALGDDTWLFGCARGLVGYRDGTWFAADRLDSMLPEQELGLYGARHTYALDVDSHGRLYVGTARGLLVYSGGLDATRLLMDSRQPGVAVSDSERAKLREQAEILLDGAQKGNGPAAKRIRDLIRNRERIAALTKAKASGLRVMQSASTGDKPAETGILDRQLRREQAEYNRRLREIEFSDPVLSQLLELKPLNLAAAAKRLPPGVAVLQLMPSRQKLYLHLVTADRTLVREIEVERDELFAKCSKAAELFRTSVGDLRGGFDVVGSSEPEEDEETAEERRAELRDLLAWIYDRALRPIEDELGADTVLLVSPAGALSQVPPSAWLRREGDAEQFAIERLSLGLLTDLHKLQIGVAPGLLGSEEALVVGDPDTTLPGAREEARQVHALLGSERELLLGESATFERILSEGEGASVVHLATHGRIDVRNPVATHLVLGNGERMMVYDICNLPLDMADFAVLSACESGVGISGQAYGSLASAFLNAGVPITIATQWKVSDRWSAQLVKDFYEAYGKTPDVHRAMAEAQRAMIREHGHELSPSAWAGYVVFGVPPE